MRAHGDSSASSVGDTFAKPSDNSQANLNGGSSHRIPKSLAAQLLYPANLSPSPSDFFERARGKVFHVHPSRSDTKGPA